MKYCFIMQPFDNGKFDKRFSEIIEPIVVESGYFPYRVDRDDSADVLIDKIEEKIAISEVCIAEITTNNPNVWYELGYAVAKGKKVIMLCSDERVDEAFPFDVRHRNILTYGTKAPSDFDIFRKRLKQRLNSAIPNSFERPLSDLERLLLNHIYYNQNTSNEVVPKEKIRIHGKDDVSAALKRLVDSGFLEYIYSVDDSSVQSNYYRLTEKAISLIQEPFEGVNQVSHDEVATHTGCVCS